MSSKFEVPDRDANMPSQSSDVVVAEREFISGEQQLRRLWRSVAVVLGAVQAWSTRDWMFPDGMSYLDLGDAYLRGDWVNAVNAHWSPLYCWILGAGVAVFRPDVATEFPLVHAANFGIYLAAIVCFEFLLKEAKVGTEPAGTSTGRGAVGISPEALTSLAYPIFVWSSLCLISLGNTTPDMCLAALVYLATGLVLRIRRGHGTPAIFFCLGVSLGIGYLAKAVMFPLSAIFALVAFLAYGQMRGLAVRAAALALAFVATAGPYVAALSFTQEKFTYSESGTHAYAWLVNEVRFPAHWQGGPKGHGEPLHPTRLLLTSPRVYEFAEPIGGTYPPWYDPTYWYKGVQPQFGFDVQLRRTMRMLRDLGVIVFYDHSFAFGAVIVPYLFGLLCSRGQTSFSPGTLLNSLVRQYPLILPAVAALGMYSLVLVRARYIAAFVVLLALSSFGAIRIPRASREDMHRVCLSLGICIWVLVAVQMVRQQPGITVTTDHVQVARELHRLGVEEGTQVAHIGNSFKAYWARLGRFRIVCEIRPEDAKEFWSGDRQMRERVYEAFRGSGAQIVISRGIPRSERAWRQIPGTEYSVHSLVSKHMFSTDSSRGQQ